MRGLAPYPWRLRVARPTEDLDAIRAFYVDALGLEELGSFRDHDGYDGIMVGARGRATHLEFTRHAADSACPPPTRDNLLVFYLPDAGALADVSARLRSLGHQPVPPQNPYWEGRGVTFEDPDGWRIVLMEDAPTGGTT